MTHYLNNAFNLMQENTGGTALLAGPQKLYLDMTQDCNLYCQMCRDEVQMHGKTMPMTLFQRLVDETVPYCTSYALFLWGDPLVLPDFRERVQYVYEKKREHRLRLSEKTTQTNTSQLHADCGIEISTSGMLLNDSMIDFLRQHEVLYVSCAKLEAEIATLEPEEKEMFLEDMGIKENGLARLISAGYELLGLISFLTAGPKEVRAWTVRKGSKAPQAAGKIHSDLERGFIRAEVVAYDDLIASGTYAGAKEKGLVRVEGKQYVVKDGDVMLILFNV